MDNVAVRGKKDVEKWRKKIKWKL